MAREALLELNCSRYSEKIIDIINLFCKVGWAYVSDDEKVEYLPIGDKMTLTGKKVFCQRLNCRNL